MAGQVDALYLFLVLITTFFSLLIAALILFFAIKYRRTPGAASGTDPRLHPAGDCLDGDSAGHLHGDFCVGRGALLPHGALARESRWKSTAWASNGCGSSSILAASAKSIRCTCPRAATVKVTLISQDVIHSFFVPAFRVKQDVLPNRYVFTWFQATVAGNLSPVLLAILRHQALRHGGRSDCDDAGRLRATGWPAAKLKAHWRHWVKKLSSNMAAPPATARTQARAVRTFRDSMAVRSGSVDNRVVVADDNYIRESILEPNAKVVSGFQSIMPTFRGVVSEDEIIAITEYIKHLSPQEAEPAE